jgi:ATP-dependent DNA ligase
VAFDLIWLDGVDLRQLPLIERRRQLQNILPKGAAVKSEAIRQVAERWRRQAAHVVISVSGGLRPQCCASIYRMMAVW